MPERHVELVTCFLAGNIFDWGAKEVTKMLETQQFGFHEAKAKIPGWYCRTCIKYKLRILLFEETDSSKY